MFIKRLLTVTLSLAALAPGSPGVRAQCTQDRIYVSDPAAGSAFAFDLAGGAVGGTFGPLSNPLGIVVDGPDSRLFVAQQSTGDIRVVGLPGGALSVLTSGLGFPFDVALTRDESGLYVVGGAGTLDLAAIPGPTVTAVTGALSSPQGVVLSADETLAFIAQANGQLRTVALTGPPTINNLASIGPSASDVELSPSGNLAYLTAAGGNLFVVDVRDGSVSPLATGLGAATKLILDQTGNNAYVVNSAGGINVVDLSNGTVAPLSLSPGVLLNPDGVALARATDPTVFVSDIPGDIVPIMGDVVVPINLSNATGRGIQTIELDLVFDPAVLSYDSAALGALTSGCAPIMITPPSVGGNTVHLEITSCGPIDGAGPVASVTFSVVGPAPGGQSDLELQNVSLGPLGSICTDDGIFYSGGGTVSGNIQYYIGGIAVDDVNLDLTPPGQATSDQSGDYLISGVTLGGPATLVPGKSGDADSGISVLDTFLAAQAAVRLITLTPEQDVAGDVTARCNTYPPMGGGPLIQQCVTIVDTLQIARRSAGLILDFAPRRDDWGFIPDPAPVAGSVITTTSPNGGTADVGSIDYNPLAASAVAQDWRAFAFGDINGDWSQSIPAPPPGMGPSSMTLESGNVSLTPPSSGSAGFSGVSTAAFGFSAGAGGLPGDSTVVSLIVDDATGAEALDVVIYYNPGVAQATNVALTPLTAGRTFSFNVNQPGVIRAGFGGEPLTGGGPLLDITFDIGNASGASMGLDLALAAVEEAVEVGSVLNDALFCVEGEGQPPAEVDNLTLDRTADGQVVLQWDADGQATAYQVYGLIPVTSSGLPVDLDDLGCLGYTVAPQITDDQELAPGQLALFLVAGQNCHGTGTLGSGNGPDGNNTNPRPEPPACN